MRSRRRVKRSTGNEKVVLSSGLEQGPRQQICVSISSFIPQFSKQQKHDPSHHQSEPKSGQSLRPHSRQKQSILQQSGKAVTNPTIALQLWG
jgi:hypothetical protein